MARIISYEAAEGPSSYDYLIIDSSTEGTRKLAVSDLVDDTFSVFGAAASSVAVGKMTEKTRNLNTSLMGHYRNTTNGVIYADPGNDKYYGMKNFIAVEPDTSYTISFGGISGTASLSASILQVNRDETFTRTGYGNINTRTITTGSDTVKLHVHVNSSASLMFDDPYIQIEKGSNASSYIMPVSAVDDKRK